MWLWCNNLICEYQFLVVWKNITLWILDFNVSAYMYMYFNSNPNNYVYVGFLFCSFLGNQMIFKMDCCTAEEIVRWNTRVHVFKFELMNQDGPTLYTCTTYITRRSLVFNEQNCTYWIASSFLPIELKLVNSCPAMFYFFWICHNFTAKYCQISWVQSCSNSA